jgi:hypothetical protein
VGVFGTLDPAVAFLLGEHTGEEPSRFLSVDWFVSYHLLDRVVGLAACLLVGLVDGVAVSVVVLRDAMCNLASSHVLAGGVVRGLLMVLLYGW